MPVLSEKKGLNPENFVWALGILLFVLVLGVTCIIFAVIEDIPDLYILGGILIFFDLIGIIFALSLILRPVYRLRQVQTDSQVPESQIEEAVRKSKTSLNSSAPTDRIHIGSSAISLQGSDVIIDVKSRPGSEVSKSPSEKKGVSFKT